MGKVSYITPGKEIETEVDNEPDFLLCENSLRVRLKQYMCCTTENAHRCL